jgi:hypothetical protein
VADVVILESTSSFQIDFVSLITCEKGVSTGISFCRFVHACEVESHDMPTRDVTTLFVEELKVNRLPTLTVPELDVALPLAWAMLPSASVAR